MKLFKEDILKFNSDDLKLNFLLLDFKDYKGGARKLIKSDSNFYNDVFVFDTGSFQGYTTKLEIFIRNKNNLQSILNYFKECDRIELPKEKGYYRKYFLDGAIEYKYHLESVILSIPLYLSGYKYKIDSVIQVLQGQGNSITINNPTNDTATPIYIINGTGEVSFTVNGVNCTLKKCSISYTLDTRDGKQNVTDSSNIPKNITSEYDGTLPLLQGGVNRITLNKGNKLTIKVNWRES